MPDNIIQDALKRLVAMEKEAVSTVTEIAGKTDAVAYWPYEQENAPYWYNRVSGMTFDNDRYSQEIGRNNYTVQATFVIDHITAGYHGEKADLAYQCMVTIEDYFFDHDRLTTTATTAGYNIEPNYLDPENGLTLVNHTGLVVIANAGISSQQLAIQFTLEFSYIRE